MKSVLDHGFVRLIDTMGDDAAIVQAARVSYGDGTKSVNDDAGLIRYLMRHHHSSPIEMCEIKLHVKMPIFVARQWIRHRTANVNEISGRYSILPNEFYVPAPENVAAQSKVNNQGRGEPLHPELRGLAVSKMEVHGGEAFDLYEALLDVDEGYGLARELARIVLPLNTYTEFYWKIDLHNLLHFLRLRLDSHAQYEIRVYAEAIAEIVREWVPATWSAFEDYRLNAVTFSGKEMQVLAEIIAPTVPDGLLGQVAAERLKELGASGGEAREFLAKLHTLR